MLFGNVFVIDVELFFVETFSVNDGDTFKILDGNRKNERVRVTGFNALESYGPVHEWQDNTLNELYNVAALATKTAQNGKWNCKLEKVIIVRKKLIL